MKTIGWGRRILLGIAGGVTAVAMAGAAFVAGPTLTAFADQGTPTPQAATGTQSRTTALERIYAREQEWLKRQADVLAKADTIAGKAQALIDKAKEKGLDVGKLQAALNAFEAQIAKAQRLHDRAAGILGAHEGFDSNGKVTDRVLALKTVKDAGNDLRSCHQTLVDAGKDLRDAIRDWRANHPRPQQSAPSNATPSSGGA